VKVESLEDSQKQQRLKEFGDCSNGLKLLQTGSAKKLLVQ
jgi:hypothetical protein